MTARRRRGAAPRALCLVLALLAGGPARAADAPPAYTVTFTGIEAPGLKDALRRASQLVALADRPPPTARALRRRAEDDLPRLRALLQSRGHYDADIAYEVRTPEEGPPAVTLRVDPGPAYTLARYAVRSTTPGEPREAMTIDLDRLGLRLGAVAESAPIVAAESRLLGLLAERGYPLAKAGARRVVADHAARTLSVDLPVAFGPRARFGKLTIEGPVRVRRAAVLRQVAWRRGAPFDARLVENTRAGLRATGLFDSVLVRHGETVGEDGEIPMTIAVTERDRRTIGVGASYSSTEGPSLRGFWQHRNLFGNGERLNLRAEGGLVTRRLSGALRFPDVGRKDQDLQLDVSYTEEDQEGFFSTGTAATLRLDRRFSEIYSASAGIGIDRSTVEENAAERDFSLLLLPLALRRDTKDSLLDPTTGGLDELTFTPHLGVLGTETNFYVARLFDSIHVPLDAERTVILAGWARIGTILGEKTADIPADKRLYAGGAGSVRGYALDSIGPLDAEDDPVGGRSVTEAGLELRWKLRDPFGVVGFVEAGGVYNDEIPRWGEELQWGAGLGVRYYTAIGPLRLDFAVPLNRRNQIDDAFQVLVSLGQAF